MAPSPSSIVFLLPSQPPNTPQSFDLSLPKPANRWILSGSDHPSRPPPTISSLKQPKSTPNPEKPYSKPSSTASPPPPISPPPSPPPSTSAYPNPSTVTGVHLTAAVAESATIHLSPPRPTSDPAAPPARRTTESPWMADSTKMLLRTPSSGFRYMPSSCISAFPTLRRCSRRRRCCLACGAFTMV